MSARATRREVLAFVALADAPTPKAVRFGAAGEDTIVLDFDRIADARPWLAIFGDVLGEPTENTYPVQPDRCAYRSLNAYPRGEWRGWRVLLTASEDITGPGEPLDDTTREQLARLVQAGDRHSVPVTEYTRDDEPAGGPLPAGVEGRSLGGRRDGGAL